MSLAKFVRCRRFLYERRDFRVINHYLTVTPQTAPQLVLAHNHLSLTDGLSKCYYATSVKPHMTPSMQNWKQKKRKSKAQQKKEMAQLHEDLVKLLTKRAFEFVKNKTLFEAQGSVVTTHVFTSFPLLEGSERSLSTSGSADAAVFFPADLRKQSDFVAETMEAHLLKQQKQSNASGIQKPVVSHAVDFSANLSAGLSYVPTGAVNNFAHVRDNHKDVKDVDKSSKLISEGFHQILPKEWDLEPLTLSISDVFNRPAKHLKISSSSQYGADFQSDLKKFKAELEAAMGMHASSTMPSVHAWDEDVSLGEDSLDSTGNKGIEEPRGNSVLNKKRSIVEPIFKKSSFSSSDLKLSDGDLQNELESCNAEHSESNVFYQEVDDFSRPTSAMNLVAGSERFHIDIGVYPVVNNPAFDYDNYDAESLSDSIDFASSSDSLKTQKNLSSALGKQHLLSNMNLGLKPEQLPRQRHKAPTRKKDRTRKISDPSHLNVPESQKEEKEKSLSQKIGHINVNRELQELIDKSFIDVSCFTNSEMVAVRNLQYQASRQKYGSIELFNKLIHAVAKKRDMQTIRSLFTMIRQQELAPNLQTYAGCLECIGRLPAPDVQTCEKLLADVEKKGLELKEIANKCSFQYDEWDYVLKAIREVRPDFVPNPPRLITQYDNILLAALNVPNSQTMEKNQYALDMCKEELHARATAQLEMEQQGEVVVKSISVSSVQGGSNPKLTNMRIELFEEWRKLLIQSFERKLGVFKKKAHDNVSMTLYPYLKLFPPKEYVKIILKFLKDLLSSSNGYSPTQAMIQVSLGRAVCMKYNIESKMVAGMGEKMLKLHELYMDKYLNKEYSLDNHRLMWQKSMNQNYDTVNMDMTAIRFPAHIQKQIGKILLEMILYDLKVNANLFSSRAPERVVPAFCSIYRPDVSFFINAEIKMHPVMTKLFNCNNTESFTFDPSTVPMVTPPVPWISKNMGGLLLSTTGLVRIAPDMFHMGALKTVTEEQYPAVLDSINTLSACAWKINKPILDLQIDIFNNKGNAELKVSPPASELPPMPVITEDMSSKDKALLYRQRLQLQQQKQDMHSLWCTDLYRLSIANKFRDEVFWFPHSIDFRGRTYPLPPHFNHLGSDNVRSMLLFAKGKPLGQNGYDWLKIHLINLTGFKKRCSNAERLNYAHSIMDQVLDSADKPLTGNKWWQTSDEPWQTLACCMEIAKIERYEGNKKDYVCRFPVHQDGSCNGLQHYAALGRDQAGAESVNLHPFDVPKDVYSDVVELVEKTRQQDAEEGNEMAKALEGFIKRKVIKQTIMTTVYGVTKYGAKLQIHHQLKDIPELPPDIAWKASFYLMETTFSCLQEMFTATKDIQDWFTESARLISAATPMEWVTPLGFPVLQPYFKRINKAESRHDRFKPNIMKQKNAFPPNYIHSLDSTHMMLTSLYCMHAGVTYVSVHDCYWTHACDVHIMNKICREQFVNMHNQPLLEDLSQHLISVVKRIAKDPNLEVDINKHDVKMMMDLLSNVPKQGSFDLNNVLKSTYFFS